MARLVFASRLELKGPGRWLAGPALLPASALEFPELFSLGAWVARLASVRQPVFERCEEPESQGVYSLRAVNWRLVLASELRLTDCPVNALVGPRSAPALEQSDSAGLLLARWANFRELFR